MFLSHCSEDREQVAVGAYDLIKLVEIICRFFFFTKSFSERYQLLYRELNKIQGGGTNAHKIESGSFCMQNKITD